MNWGTTVERGRALVGHVRAGGLAGVQSGFSATELRTLAVGEGSLLGWSPV